MGRMEKGTCGREHWDKEDRGCEDEEDGNMKR
jgi:hypothetical protein